jgi:cysteine desulfurase
MRKSAKVGSFIHGGGQERNMRAGTENVVGIVGLAAAAKLAYESLDQDAEKITSLKQYAIQKLSAVFPDIDFNGPTDDTSLYTVLNISLPAHPMGSLLLFQLDMKGICVSGGSACSSGAAKGSHVIEALKKSPDRIAIRCSFCRETKVEEVDAFVAALQELYAPV